MYSGGRSRFLVRGLLVFGALAVLLGGVAALGLVPEALALTQEEREQREAEREQRRAEREAAREARRAEREAARAARAAEREAEKLAEENAPCGCSAALSLARPELQFRDNQLVFVPRVDIDVKTKGEPGGPDWAVSVVYEGETGYESEDIAVPAGVSFSGEQAVTNGVCGDNRYRFNGVALPAVTLSGLTRTLLQPDQELAGRVEMKASVQGCGFEEEHKAFQFSLEEFGQLLTRSWRAIR